MLSVREVREFRSKGGKIKKLQGIILFFFFFLDIIKNEIMLFAAKWMDLSSVHFSHSVVSDSLQPHGLQHARPLCPSPTPGV